MEVLKAFINVNEDHDEDNVDENNDDLIEDFRDKKELKEGNEIGEKENIKESDGKNILFNIEIRKKGRKKNRIEIRDFDLFNEDTGIQKILTKNKK